MVGIRIFHMIFPLIAIMFYACTAVDGQSSALMYSDSWRLEILNADNLAEATVKGEFAVLPDGGRNGEDVIEFASPIELRGQIRIDLSNLDITQYDQLHFDLWMEEEASNITATLRGYPDEFHGRRWYVMKRFQPLEQWTDIRLDLDLDDDLSRSVFEDGEKSLVLDFSRPEAAGEAFPRARISSVRLVRSPIKMRTDYRETSFEESETGLRFTYPVHLTNSSEQALQVQLELLPETLEHFKGSLAATTRTLAPGEQWTTTATIAIGSEYNTLPTGHAERAQIRVSSPNLPGFDAVPIRGYRPVYLFGMVPPRAEDRNVFYKQLQARAERLSAGALAGVEKNLDWQVETPPLEVIPAYGMTFRCPECNSLMDISNLYTYFCYSRDIPGNCEKHMEHVEVDKDHQLFAAMVDYYHGKNANLARDMALAWLRSGDARFADKAFEILISYENMFRDLPLVAPASTGYHNRFRSATLHERHVLESFADAYLALRDGGYQRQDELQTIAEGLLEETLYSVNLHNYGFSASQVDMITQAMKAAVITQRWVYFADAISGDGGINRILTRTFDEDGAGRDGGDYARQATNQITTLAAFLQELGLSVNRERIEQIRLTNAILGYTPLPQDFQWETMVLPNTGFTILVNGSGDSRRRATINWGSNRERGAHDFLTTVLHDQNDDKLLLRTRRIAWGRKESFFSYESVSQNIPVVDEGNIQRTRLHQEYLVDDDAVTAVIISDYPDRPAYADSRLTRSLLLFEGCLLVLDRVRSTAGERQFDFPVYGLMRFAKLPDEMTPLAGELGETPAYKLPKNLMSMPVEDGLTMDWTDDNRGLRLHMLGDNFEAFAGVSLTAWQANERGFLMLRTRGEAATSSMLYEATTGEHPKVTTFARVEVKDAQGNLVSEDRALGYNVSFDDGRTLRALVSLDGGAYQSGDVTVDTSRRVAVGETAN